MERRFPRDQHGERRTEIRFRKEDAKLTAGLNGRLDTSASPELKTERKPLLKDTTELITELSELAFITSAGLRVLLKAAQAMEGQGK